MDICVENWPLILVGGAEEVAQQIRAARDFVHLCMWMDGCAKSGHRFGGRSRGVDAAEMMTDLFVRNDWALNVMGDAEAVTQQKRAADGKREDLEKRLQERKQDLDETQFQLQRYKVGCTLLLVWRHLHG
jgi:hypothetical protein